MNKVVCECLGDKIRRGTLACLLGAGIEDICKDVLSERVVNRMEGMGICFFCDFGVWEKHAGVITEVFVLLMLCSQKNVPRVDLVKKNTSSLSQ